MRVLPQHVDLSRVKTEIIDIRGRRGRRSVRDQRDALAAPPFVQDRKLWDRAVELFRRQRSAGQLPGEPYIVLTNVYRSLGGEFR